MAEFVMKDLIRRNGLEGSFHIDSAGTTTEERGNPIHPGTRNKLREKNIPQGSKYARPLKPTDYASFDLIIGMDRENLYDMKKLFNDDPEDKVRLLMDYADSGRDIDDPWYTGDFSTTYRDILDGCLGLLHEIQQEHHHNNTSTSSGGL
jgi:protein-tyrosine phosphatase